MQTKRKELPDQDPKRPKIITPPLCDYLRIVHCIITDEERFQARIKRWDRRNNKKRTRLDFYD